MLDEDHNEIDDGDGDSPDADAVSSRRQLASYAVRSSYGEFRRSGVHQVGAKFVQVLHEKMKEAKISQILRIEMVGGRSGTVSRCHTN